MDISEYLAEWRAGIEDGPGVEDGDADTGLSRLGQYTQSDDVILRVSRCSNLDSRHIEPLGRALPPHLRKLNLDLSHNFAFQDVGRLSRGLSHLMVLETLVVCLDGCESLDRVGEFGPGLSGLKMLLLKLSNCVRLLRLDSFFGQGLVYLEALTSLTVDFHDCFWLSNIDEFAAGLARLRTLEHLVVDLGGCRSLTSIDEVARSLAQLPLLSSLTLVLTGCQALGNLFELGEVLPQLRLLRTLHLSVDAHVFRLRRGSPARNTRTFQSAEDFIEAHRAMVAAAVAAATAMEIVEGINLRDLVMTLGSSTATTGLPDSLMLGSRSLTPGSYDDIDQQFDDMSRTLASDSGSMPFVQ